MVYKPYNSTFPLLLAFMLMSYILFLNRFYNILLGWANSSFGPTVHIVFCNIATFCINTQLFLKDTVINSVTFLSTLASALWTTLLLLFSWLQHARLPCPSPSPKVCSNSCPLSLWCHPIISSCRPPLLLPSILPSIRVFSNESALCIQVAKVLELQLQHQSFQWIFRVGFL